MTLSTQEKQNIITEFKNHDTDTGSTDVQIAILSNRISQLTGHFKTHKKDHSGRRGLLRMVGRRRKLLNYLKKHNLEGYKTLISQLGIRK